MASTSAASDSGGLHVRGRFADGRAALVHDAAVEAGPDALHIRYAGGEAAWAWADIERRDGAPGEARLAWRGDEAQRLTLSEADWRALRPAGSRAGDGRVKLVREAKIAAGLLAAAAAAFAIVFLGAPVMAEAAARWAPPAWEARMGDAAQRQVGALFPPCAGRAADAGAAVLGRLAGRLSATAGARFPIQVAIVRTPLPNAFALPAGRVVVTSGLIHAADSPDEVAGVLAHEIAHISERHVVKGFVRAMTLGALADLFIGGGTGAAAPLAAGVVNLTALRYSRADETEADRLGMDYLEAAGLDPGALARFFDRVLKLDDDVRLAGRRLPEFFSDHPDTRRRAAASRARAKPGAAPALEPAEWDAVKRACPAGE